MKYRTLGKTNISVSVVAMGCWSIVGSPTWGKQDEKDSIETIKKALDLGVNFFDTAEEYEYGDGSSESLLGKALTNCRHKAVISSKVSSSGGGQPRCIEPSSGIRDGALMGGPIDRCRPQCTSCNAALAPLR